jgi:predicted  nucleic acid-binding Zn-ribbon protein
MESLREKIVRLSRELADTTDEQRIKSLRKQIAALKERMTPTEPTKLGGFFKKES